MSTSERAAILRHACLACGGSCQGGVVMLSQAEQGRMRALGEELGLGETVDAEGSLAKVDGACVFQRSDGLCRVHAERGMAAKPAICRQFPLVVTVAEDGPRAGVDPACYTAIRTWRDGPPVAEGAAQAGKVPFSESEAAVEHRVLDLLELEGQSVAGALCGLTGSPAGPGGLPQGYPGRLVDFARRVPLRAFLRGEGIGRALSDSLEPLALTSARWLPQAPPRWPALSPEAEAWAVEAVRRVIWLRLDAHLVRQAQVVALLGLSGAVLCGWTHGRDDEAFGRALAAWLRAMRFRSFLERMPADLNRLASG
ncbi:MAG: YkgJ family cysteine cluster protein [Alphaproteobacteria bacterium]|nr:YkgJ family cysteine cluster protein [Alphaproteobacteria bacterium]